MDIIEQLIEYCKRKIAETGIEDGYYAEKIRQLSENE